MSILTSIVDDPTELTSGTVDLQAFFDPTGRNIADFVDRYVAPREGARAERVETSQDRGASSR